MNCCNRSTLHAPDARRRRRQQSALLPTLIATSVNVGKGRGRDRPTYHDAARTDIEMSFKRFLHNGSRPSLAYNPKLKSQCAALELKL